MGFDFPHPPDHTTFPQHGQTVAEVVMAVLVLAFAIHAIAEWRRGRGPLALLLLLGGAVSYLNEPFLDVLGLLWHPRPGQDVAVDTLGPVPLWGLGIYTVFFGSGSYLLLRALERGVTRRQVWIGMGVFFAVNLAVELPLLGVGLYHYYGYRTPPMSLGGLPLFWLFINAGAPLVTAAVLLAARPLLTGPRLLAVVLAPMTVYAGYAMATGWPVFSAVHTEGLPAAVAWGAALLTTAMGALAIDAVGTWAERRAGRGAAGPVAVPEAVVA